MSNTKSMYAGPERRTFRQKQLEAVPRWVFISTLSSMLGLAVIFASWHVSSLEKLEDMMVKEVLRNKQDLDKELLNVRSRYYVDRDHILQTIQEVHSDIGALTSAITIVKIRVGRTEAKQDLILEKVQLTK